MFDRRAPLALVVAVLTLLASGVGFRYAVLAARAHLQKQTVDLRAPLDSVPTRLGDWEATGEDVELTAEVEEALGTDKFLSRAYVRRGGEPLRVSVHVDYYTGFIDAVPHVPDRCLVAGGWQQLSLPENVPLPVDRSRWRPDPGPSNLRTGEPYQLLTYRHPVTGRPVQVRMPQGEFRLRTSAFSVKQRPDDRIWAGYFFLANGQITPWPERVRQFAFDLTTRHAYYAKVQFTVLDPLDLKRDEFVEIVSGLLDELLPELLRCLPDWSEVEALERSPAASS